MGGPFLVTKQGTFALEKHFQAACWLAMERMVLLLVSRPSSLDGLAWWFLRSIGRQQRSKRRKKMEQE
jgi:hypothetical protein